MHSRSSAPRHILVVGLGYVGRPLAERLAAQGHRVTGVSRTPARIAQSGFSLVEGDLGDAASLARVARELGDIVQVVHCAASGRGGGEAEYAKVYREGAENLVAAFPGAQVLFTSSTSVYPQIDGTWITEESPAEPSRGTGKILRAAENAVLASGGTVARLGGIYGPGRSVLLRNFLQGKAVIDTRLEPPLTPDGRWINQIHLHDILGGLCHLLSLPAAFTRGQIFNLTDSRPMTQREVYSEMVLRFGGKEPPAAPPEENRKRGWAHKRLSNARLVSTGWHPQYPDFFSACDHDSAFLPSILAQVEETGLGDTQI